MKPYRKQKVASLIQSVVGETIAHELHDPRVGILTSVTRVEVSGDLLQAKVFLSVMGGDSEERTTLNGVRHAGGFIQRRVAAAVQLRQCPHLTFEIDEGAKTARETLRILDENRRRRGESEAVDEPMDAGGQEDGPDQTGEEAGR